jgi:OOP family OmpA-OmpF porin
LREIQVMQIRIITTLVACWLLLPGGPALAEHEPQQPFYIGFALGFPGADQQCDYYGYNCDGSDTGFKIYGGKQLHENFAVEISYQDLGRLRKDRGSFDAIAESEGFNLSLLGIIPLGEVAFAYGKAGYMLSDTRYSRVEGDVTTKTDDQRSDFTFGAGFGFRFNHKYDLRAEFESLNDLTDDYVPGGDTITSFSIGGTIYLD